MTLEGFDSKNYWRGPVWININWMISQGLRGYGYREKADAMNRDMIQLPIRFGFHEYFDSKTGEGYGSSNFSWTTALFLDLVYRYYDKDRPVFDRLKLRRTKRLKGKKILNQGESGNSPPKNVAAHLMGCIVDLKDKFYDLNRGLVDYEAMKHSAEYDRYRAFTARLQDFDPTTLSSLQQKKAFWINLYNTIVVEGIVELGIRSSVREIGNFFSHIVYRVGEFTLSAEEIEHGILRANARPPYRVFPKFKRTDPRLQLSLESIDPRIHFALVCGSRSCAPIRFYDEGVIDEQLEKATRNFINSSEVIVLPEENKIFLSQIFDWYQKDFGGREKLLTFLLKYLDKPEKCDFLENHNDRLAVEYLYYDWNLNH
jgi:hypothetical protein